MAKVSVIYKYRRPNRVQVTGSEGGRFVPCLSDCGRLSELLLVNKISMFNNNWRIITTMEKVTNLMPNVNCFIVPSKLRFASKPGSHLGSAPVRRCGTRNH